MRSKQLNVSPDVYDALWTLGKANKKDEPTEHRLSIVTPDEIADTVLRIYINDNHPNLFEQLVAKQKQVDYLDKQLIESLTNENKTVLINPADDSITGSC